MSTKAELLKTIYKKCMDCTADQRKEVDLCPSEDCPLWPFRLGKDPYKARRTLTDAQKENLAEGRRKAKNRLENSNAF